MITLASAALLSESTWELFPTNLKKRERENYLFAAVIYCFTSEYQKFGYIININIS